jgi:pimeloyl-ACP methyl ester carboxylesterase
MNLRFSRAALAALTLAAVAGLTACNKNPASATADNQASPPVSQAPATQPDGLPQLTLTKDFVHIDYRVWGKGEPAVILIHGWACDSNYWRAQVEALKARYTVVALNLAGHGASENNRNDWSMANYGGDVAAVAQQLKNRQIVLVGHSMGADVALEAAPLVGDRVIGIIAVDSLKSIGLPPMTQKEIDAKVAPFQQSFIEATRDHVIHTMFQKDADPSFVQKVAYDMSLEPPAVAIPSLRALWAMDFNVILPNIHVPVYAINSDLTPTDEARIRKSLPAGFKVDVLDHTGHFLMMEVPQRFNPVLLKDVDALVQQAKH